MQHKATDEPKKAKGRPKWAFVENMGSSLALIHKQNPDDINFVLELLKLAGNGIVNYFMSFFSSANTPAPDTRLKERAAIAHLDLVKRLTDLDSQRAKVNKRIYTAQESKQTPAPEDIAEKAKIQEEINFLYFGPDVASIKLNEVFANHAANIANLRAQKAEVDARIEKIKEYNKAQKKTGGKPLEIDPKDEELINTLIEKIDAEMVAMVILVQENIREHARRRVDTFLLLCIALYKTNMKLTYIPRAPIQIGEGSKLIGTEACHAALMKQIVLEKAPSATTVLIDSLDKVKEVLQTFISIFKPGDKPLEPVKAANMTEMELRIMEANKNVSEKSWFDDLFSLASSRIKPEENATSTTNVTKGSENKKPISEIIDAFEYKNSYLEELLNITTDLPEVVNDFDGLLEGKFGKVSPFIQTGISIVNRVSTGELHPLKAMNEFGEIAELFYSTMNYTYFKAEKISSLLAFKQSADLVCRYEREGTFAAYYPKSTIISQDYICLMLGLKSMSFFEKAATFFSYIGFVDDRIMEMQRTILTADPMRVKMPEHKAKYAAEKKKAADEAKAGSKAKSKVKSLSNSNNIQSKSSGP